MAKKRRYARRKKQTTLPGHKLIGAVIAAFASLLAASLYTFCPHDPSWFYYATDHSPIQNSAGRLGAYLSAALLHVFGLASYILVPLTFGVAWMVWNKKTVQEEWDRLVGGGVILLMGSMLLYAYRLNVAGYFVPGGVVGKASFVFLHYYLETPLALLGIWCSLLAASIIVARMSFVVIFESIFKVVRYIFSNWRQWVMPIVGMMHWTLKTLFVPLKLFAGGLIKLLEGAHKKDQRAQKFEYRHESEPVEMWHAQLDKSGHSSPPIDTPDQGAQTARQEKKQRTYSSRSNSFFKSPQDDLFDDTAPETFSTRTDQHEYLAEALEEKLTRFGISGKVTSIKPGPVITLFEYQPVIDAKVSKILGLEHDLALALEAMSVRIIAPIPGTPRVGFEVSNKERHPVFMRDIVRSATFQKTKARLPIVLGKDTAGGNVVIDLVDTPHLLVAGSTGSGKSVALNTLLVSLLCKLTPDELRLIIIDPKRLEFASYQDIPHLLFPIITQPHKAAPVLRWLVKVMEERYEMMAEMGARSIFDYKTKCKKNGTKDELPYIVLMIDELADLMMVARRDIEDSIARLAQMARAAGIHLIVATQRPSVDVLTGVIKVNFPSRMSFRVTSKVDSRTVLDALGAETLLGKGDMLFIDAHSARMRRIHGAYVDDGEINRIVEHIKAQQEVEYTDLEEVVAATTQTAQQDAEPLLPEVIAYLTTIEEVSISLLQRRFKIGYNRSARIIEMLESQGRIMPSSGGKTRKVIHN